MDIREIDNNLTAMAGMPNYTCFALFDDKELVGVASGWTTVRVYCGKQIELDNVVIDQKMQSQGLGKYFIKCIKQWTVANDFQSIGLNTYVENDKSHKFYFNHGFSIIGYHFENTTGNMT